jgi:NDP-sugar pyrophosphorylase family protein
VDYLDRNIIDELIICDENGNDYDKIHNKYNNLLISNSNFKIYKNENNLGVFKNKLKVCSLASNNYIALIDSDNFCDENYFITAKNYIQNNENKFSNNIILSPSFARPNFNYKRFENSIVTKYNLKDYYYKEHFQTLLNTGNYILNKNIINKIHFDDSVMFQISACDVLFFNLLVFQQFEDLQIHVVKDLEYEHVVHNGSIYLNTIKNCENYINSFILPAYKKLLNN